MTTIIKLKRDTAANWTIINPILAAGEPGLETDTLKIKYGDGANTWANLAYQSVANATFATTAAVANSVDVANVANIGNIATINLDGNANTVLYGNGVFAPGGSGGSSDELINGDNSFVLDIDGNVVFQGAEPGDGINRGLVWDYGVEQNGVNSEVRQDNNGITIRAWTENQEGSYSAPVNIVTNQDANTNTWTFDGVGNLTLAGNLKLPGNIESISNNPPFNSGIIGINSGNANVIITLADEVFVDPYSGPVTISGVNPPLQVNGNWWYQAVNIDQFQLFTDSSLSTPVDGTEWPGYVDGGTAVSIAEYTNFSIQGGNVSVRSNDKIWTFDTTGTLHLAEGNGIIQSIPNSAGDLSGLSTLHLTPDDTVGDDRYLIVDPTGPNHIHIRPGGNIDNSNADFYLGGEVNFVRISDSSNSVRMQNQTLQFNGSYSFDTSLGYSSAAWQDDGVGGYQVIINDPTVDVFDAVFNLNNDSFIEIYDGANYNTLTYGDGSSTPGGGPITFSVNEAPPSSPIAIVNLQIDNYILRTNYTEVNGSDFTVNVYDDVRITGSDIVTLRNRSNADPITIISDYDSSEHTWSFHANAVMEIPGNLITSGASPAPTLSGFSSISAADEIVVGSNAVSMTSSGDISLTGNVSATNIGNISATNLDGNVSNVLTGNGTFVTLPVINANTVVWSTAPISNVATGNAGEAAYDSGGNLYVCVVANTWSKFTGTTSW